MNANISDEHAAFIFRVQVSEVNRDGTQSGPIHTVHRQCDTRFVTVEWSYVYRNLCSKWPQIHADEVCSTHHNTKRSSKAKKTIYQGDWKVTQPKLK